MYNSLKGFFRVFSKGVFSNTMGPKIAEYYQIGRQIFLFFGYVGESVFKNGKNRVLKIVRSLERGNLNYQIY